MKPCTKKRFTKKEAQENLNYLLRKGTMDKGRIYQCSHCNQAWHITHKDFFDDDELKKTEVKSKLKNRWKIFISK